jgi:hypothetical protein
MDPLRHTFSARTSHDNHAQAPCRRHALALLGLAIAVFATGLPGAAQAARLSAGAAKVDITNVEAGPVNDPLYVKALVLRDDATTAVIITVDAVAIGEIGHIRNEYLGQVRDRLQQDLGIPPQHVMINASHCHGVVCGDVAERTVRAVKQAWENVVPVKIGSGTGHEDRVMENRRLKLTNGKEADVRHAYSLPPDAEVASVGPVDPEIGLLRFDRLDGTTVAVVYNFAVHPIQGVPGGANTADMTGFASSVIEDNLSDGAVALFVQGCAGDINPIMYKDVEHPRHAEPLGNMLGLSALKGLKPIETHEDVDFRVINEVIELPRADLAERIYSLQNEQASLLGSLQGTSLNLKTFLPLIVKYNLDREFPSYYSHRYLTDEMLGREDLKHLDAENRRNLKAYMQNIYTMEELTRVQTNLNLLRKHQEQNVAAGKRTIDVEMVGLRLGDFVMVTFPGELVVEIGLNLKQASPHERTFIAGYTNGYIYYAPTAEQLQNVGGAQEDSDCILAPEWQAIFEDKALQMLGKL